MKWEYMAIERYGTDDKDKPRAWKDDADLEMGQIERLNLLGQDDWQLVGFQALPDEIVYILIRPVTPKPEPFVTISTGRLEQWVEGKVDTNDLTPREQGDLKTILKLFNIKK